MDIRAEEGDIVRPDGEDADFVVQKRYYEGGEADIGVIYDVIEGTPSVAIDGTYTIVKRKELD